MLRFGAKVLWFDVEERYNTTYHMENAVDFQLWFDVEERYNTTNEQQQIMMITLWFDVEERYNTTVPHL